MRRVRFPFSWLNLQSRRGPRPRGPAPVRPAVEPLETRELLSANLAVAGSIVRGLQTSTGQPPVVSASGIAPTEGATFTGPIATFTGADPNPADYTALVPDWGPSDTTVTGANGTFTVYANHFFADEGRDITQVIVTDSHGQTGTDTFQIDVEPTTLNPSARDLAATQGTAFTGPVATFTDPDPNARPGEYGVTITWGDGTGPDTTGTVVRDAQGGFDVVGSHTYANGGSFPVQVQITNGLTDTATLNTATAQGTATVASPTLVATPVAASAPEGVLYNGVVASFSAAGPPRSARPPQAAGRYHATVTGDDYPELPFPGVIAADGHGGYTVRGSFPYLLHPGQHGFTVTVSADGGSTTAVRDTLTVTDAPLSAAALPVAATAGRAFTGVVATFHDPYPYAAPNYTAAVDWGDGSVPSAGAIRGDGRGGFTVSGGHTYARAGSYAVRVTASDFGGSTAVALGTATVAAPPPSLTAVGTWAPSALAGLPGGAMTLAEFRDNGPPAAPAYQVTIAWGDGTTSAGQWTERGGIVRVSGRHTYLQGGTYHPLVTLRGPGASATVVGTVHVAADVSAQVVGAASPLVFNPATGLYAGAITLTNPGKTDLAGPLWLVFKGLDRRAKLVGAFDLTAAGDPVLRVVGKKLAAGRSLTVAVQFAGPAGLKLAETVATFAGG